MSIKHTVEELRSLFEIYKPSKKDIEWVDRMARQDRPHLLRLSRRRIPPPEKDYSAKSWIGGSASGEPSTSKPGTSPDSPHSKKKQKIQR